MRFTVLACVLCFLAGAIATMLLRPDHVPDAGMESQSQSSHGQMPAVTAVEPPRPAAGSTRPAGRPPRLATLQQDSEERFARLDRAFMGEPVDRQWAGRTETMIRDAFSSEEAVRMGVEPPGVLDIQCRSASCRIEAVYAGAGAAADASQMLLFDVSDQLPDAQLMTFENPDGSSRIVIHAGRGNSLPARPANAGSPAAAN